MRTVMIAGLVLLAGCATGASMTEAERARVKEAEVQKHCVPTTGQLVAEFVVPFYAHYRTVRCLATQASPRDDRTGGADDRR